MTPPLLRAVELLRPHARAIEASWRAELRRQAASRREFDALAALNPRTLLARLRDDDSTDLQRELVAEGERLASLDVPLELAISASILGIEFALPYLVDDGTEPDSPALALTRLNSKARLYLISGYANHRSAKLEKLEHDLAAAEEHLQGLSRIITDVYDKERRRISRDLHDQIGHDLVVLKLYLEMIARDLGSGNVRRLHQKLEEAIALVGTSVDRVRRLSFELGPAISEELGFVPALRVYARQFAARTGIRVRLRAANLRVKVPSTYEMTLYRVLQGALSNVVRHSRARAVQVSLSSGGQAVEMVVQDDGVGFQVTRAMRSRAGAFGLRTMRERIELLGGELEVESRRSGPLRGTTVRARLPLLPVSRR